MSEVDPREVLFGLLVFIVLSFLFKVALLTGVANLTPGLFSDDSVTPIYLGILVAVAVTGLAVGKFLNARVSSHALIYGLLVGALAGIYKAFRPDLNPMPAALVLVFSLLNFAAVVWGVHVTSRTQR